MIPKLSNSSLYANSAVSTTQRAEKEQRQTEEARGAAARESGSRMDKIQISHSVASSGNTEALPPVTFNTLKNSISQSIKADTPAAQVQSLKQQVDGNNYYTNASEIARAMISD